MTTPITEAQAKTLAFIVQSQRENQMPPTRTEIAQHFGWKSANAAQEHLEALERKGAIRLRKNVARGIFVL
jgi:repressor LexA